MCRPELASPFSGWFSGQRTAKAVSEVKLIGIQLSTQNGSKKPTLVLPMLMITLPSSRHRLGCVKEGIQRTGATSCFSSGNTSLRRRSDIPVARQRFSQTPTPLVPSDVARNQSSSTKHFWANEEGSNKEKKTNLLTYLYGVCVEVLRCP